MPEPMSNERRAEIRKNWAELSNNEWEPTGQDIYDLLTEIERLCVREEELLGAIKEILRKSRIHISVEDWDELEAALEVKDREHE